MNRYAFHADLRVPILSSVALSALFLSGGLELIAVGSVAAPAGVFFLGLGFFQLLIFYYSSNYPVWQFAFSESHAEYGRARKMTRLDYSDIVGVSKADGHLFLKRVDRVVISVKGKDQPVIIPYNPKQVFGTVDDLYSWLKAMTTPQEKDDVHQT